jgi:hypothetical protein
MRYLKRFKATEEYNSFKNSTEYIEPNVSVIEDLTNSNTTIHYNPYIPPIITFYVSNTAYEAVEGMTWEQWINSEYCTQSAFRIESGGRVYFGMMEVGSVKASDEIIAGNRYRISSDGQ